MCPSWEDGKVKDVFVTKEESTSGSNVSHLSCFCVAEFHLARNSSPKSTPTERHNDIFADGGGEEIRNEEMWTIIGVETRHPQ